MIYPEGLDLSKYDSVDYDWASFVIVRLGSIFGADARREQHVTFARDHGIPIGTYWFLYNENLEPEAQAQWAFNLMRDLDLTYLPHFADCEGELTTDNAKRYIAAMQELKGDCGIYSGWWVKSRGGPTLGADYGWLPEYHDTYVLPAKWTPEFTKVWQWTSTTGTLDRDRFLGTADEMKSFFGGDMAAVDEMLDGMTQAETASQGGTVDPGVPPDTLTNYGKKGWNRVRFNVNRIAVPLATAERANEAIDTGQNITLVDHESRVVALEQKPTHTHSTTTVAGPAT